MDRLKDKVFENYDYVSRYTSTPYYYDEKDKKYIYGIGSQLKKDAEYTLHKLTDIDTLDSLALTYYGNPTYYWVIAYFNDIMDIFEPLGKHRSTIKIPSLTAIGFEEK